MPAAAPGADVAVVTALRAEAYAVSAALPDALDILCTGMGPQRASEALAGWRLPAGHPVALAGLGGALVAGLAPGDVVVASAVVDTDGRTYPVPAGAPLVAELRRRGFSVLYGPVATVDHVVHGAERAELAERTGAVAVDMESGPVAAALNGAHPLAVMRVVVDTPDTGFVSPKLLPGSVRAYRTLRRAAESLQEWAAATGPRQVVLAAPRSFCAGVERAIAVVERALDRAGGRPVYVRKQIVHNAHVVAELTRRGAVFVDELDAVPTGATVIFSAHGVSPAVRAEASRRRLDVIDATCPLVSKVHVEARRYAARGDSVLLIGHAGHEETEGTLGEAPGIRLVEDLADVAALEVADPDRVSYVMQTTLAVDEAADIVAALAERFPRLSGPTSDDICYATTNRQEAVRRVAAECELLLVVGSANSANSTRLVEVAERAGAAARRVDDATDIEPGWLAGVRSVGITAGASAPPALVEEVLGVLDALGPVEVAERRVTVEELEFTLPKEVS